MSVPWELIVGVARLCLWAVTRFERGPISPTAGR